MQIFLDEIVKHYPNENLIRVMDGAGWRHSLKLILPDNLRTLFLPPYSPKLNPQEHLWDELREKHFYNKAFNSLSALENTLASTLLSLENNPQLVRSITAWDGIVNAVNN